VHRHIIILTFTLTANVAHHGNPVVKCTDSIIDCAVLTINHGSVALVACTATSKTSFINQIL